MKQLKNLFFALALCAPLTAAAQDIEINAENFPDKNFRNYLLKQDYGADGVLTEKEIKGVTDIGVYGENISSLQGIEYFTALTSLNCSNNQLSSLDVSNNTKLARLDCFNNQLSSLDMSKNTALTWLKCDNNQLASLDMSKNTALRYLFCPDNQLASLDVSKNTALTFLDCYNNRLASLNVSKNTALIWLLCYNNRLTSLNVSGCTALERLLCFGNQLTSLDVSNNTALIDLECSNNQIKGASMDAFIESLPINTSGMEYVLIIRDYIDDNEGNVCTSSQVARIRAKGWTTYYSNGIECEDSDDNLIAIIDETNFPDENFRAYLLEQDYGADGVLTKKDIKGVSEMYINGKNISTLQGIKYFTALRILDCYDNQLTSLDVSGCTVLKWLVCDDNQLTSLDVSGCTALEWLLCSNNQLTSLDLSNNKKLTYLECYKNQIKGKSMEALVSSLPESTAGELYVYYEDILDEGNVMTKAQVAAAKAKGWILYYYNSGWKEYEGSDDPTSITVTVESKGLATYCPQQGVDFSNATEIAAYKASVSDNIVTLTRVEIVAAGEGVLLRSLGGGAVEEELPVVNDATANVDNAFVGVLEATTLNGTDGNVTNFVLSEKDGEVGFFKANSTPIAAGKAYLPVENYNASRSLTIVFGDGTTGIVEVVPEKSGVADAVYTLDGVRVTTPGKGLYIKNGKKVYIK